jgi:hypothetical protein
MIPVAPLWLSLVAGAVEKVGAKVPATEALKLLKGKAVPALSVPSHNSIVALLVCFF